MHLNNFRTGVDPSIAKTRVAEYLEKPLIIEGCEGINYSNFYWTIFGSGDINGTRWGRTATPRGKLTVESREINP